MINASEKSIKDLGDQVDADEKTKVEAAITDLQETLKGEDKDAIEAKTTALTEAAGAIAQKAYAQKAEQEGGAEGEPTAEASKDDEVVDAEFEEVKEDDKK